METTHYGQIKASIKNLLYMADEMDFLVTACEIAGNDKMAKKFEQFAIRAKANAEAIQEALDADIQEQFDESTAQMGRILATLVEKNDP
jgi:hypothetical protein